MQIFSRLILCLVLAGLLRANNTFAESCYMAKEAFAVEQPYLVTKSCFLFHHGANINLENQSETTIKREGEYNEDPIHSEFIRFVVERKLISLKKDTPIFSCDYDLPTVARDFKFGGSKNNRSRTLGYDLPLFNCVGRTSMWTQVRPIYENHCFWVAVELIRCDEAGKELNPMSVTDPEENE
jgi:hypothetical protein